MGLGRIRRPQMFGGVALVCTRLFGLTRADVGVFGEKDFQQVMVIGRAVADLALPITIETVRAADGLALSSRNACLDGAGAGAGGGAAWGAVLVAERLRAGVAASEACAAAEASLLEVGFDRVDYVAVRRG